MYFTENEVTKKIESMKFVEKYLNLPTISIAFFILSTIGLKFLAENVDRFNKIFNKHYYVIALDSFVFIMLFINFDGLIYSRIIILIWVLIHNIIFPDRDVTFTLLFVFLAMSIVLIIESCLSFFINNSLMHVSCWFAFFILLISNNDIYNVILCGIAIFVTITLAYFKFFTIEIFIINTLCFECTILNFIDSYIDKKNNFKGVFLHIFLSLLCGSVIQFRMFKYKAKQNEEPTTEKINENFDKRDQYQLYSQNFNPYYMQNQVYDQAYVDDPNQFLSQNYNDIYAQNQNQAYVNNLNQFLPQNYNNIETQNQDHSYNQDTNQYSVPNQNQFDMKYQDRS